MNTNSMLIEEEQIDIREIFRTLYRYRYMIILFVLLFGLASGFYAYFQPNVYKASATVEVDLEKGAFGSEDILAMATDAGSMNADTEIDIIKSRFLTQKALDKVDLAHRYYTTRNYKEVELYNKSPFQVGMLKGYDVSFELYPVDAEHYHLVVEDAEDKEGNEWSYDAILPYSEEIVTEHFHLNVAKVKEPHDAEYRFVVMDPQTVANDVKEGVSVTKKSKLSNMLEISYSDNVALRAQEFTNALAGAYIAQNVEKKTKEATRKLTFIDKQLKLITENLKSSAVKLEEFKKTSNTVNLSDKAENIIRKMSGYETKLAEISIEQGVLNKLYKQVQSGENLESIAIAGIENNGGSSLSSGSSLSGIVKELQAAIIQKKVLREDYTEMSTSVIKINKTIAQLKSVLVSTIENLKKTIEERKTLLEQSIAQEQKILDTLPADERMYGQLQRKFAVNEKIYSYLLEKRSETAIVKASTVSKNRIIDEALYPELPIKPKRKLIVLVGLIVGLMLGVALAFLRDFLDDRIKDEEDITRATQVPVLGLIPHLKDNSEAVQVFVSPKSAFAESFRNLRTNLQFMTTKKKGYVIAITSTIGGEGKTTSCINLGGIMSLAEKRTVILNLDMRKPTLHEKFGLGNMTGMSALLAGHVGFGEVVQKTEYENLDIITSGPVPPNPSELIQSVRMENVLEKLKEVYDIIILDTPPIGLVTDARTLMHFADASIYVLRADYSKKDFLRSVEKLSKEEISGFGILLNDVKMNKGGYGYGYGSGYGYYEEDKK